jgi:tetraacyldisaccharide 4'-kinase
MNEAALHELLSGRRKDLAARFLRSSLRAAEFAYALTMRLRNVAYDRKWLEIHRVSVPVISVGNITTGGTGKTPVAAWLANWLKEQHCQPALISRGYRALAETPETADGQSAPENDEKLVLDRLCPGVPHLQQRDRVRSARRAIQEFGCDVLLLDDGFQHRRLHRDLDLVLVDALQPWGYGHVLPRGLLRESLDGLKRADLILITRSDQCSSQQRQVLMEQLYTSRTENEFVEIAFKPTRLVDLDWQPHSVSEVLGHRLFAFCGIGNPHGFEQTIKSLGGSLVQILPFPDHHHYQPQDLSTIAEMARKAKAELVLTTQKDLVKIAPNQWHGPPLMAVEIGVDFVSGESLITSLLHQVLL